MVTIQYFHITSNGGGGGAGGAAGQTTGKM
jgi:hypothetical protein